LHQIYYMDKEEEKFIFRGYFENELKRLGLKRKVVCEMLNCTAPTLKDRINNPGRFTISEINKLENNGFEIKKRLI